MKHLLRCPKCRAFDLEITEVGTHYTTFAQNDRFLDPEGVHNPGSHFKVEAYCLKCRHGWTVRGAVQITDLPSHPDYRGKSDIERGRVKDHKRRGQ